jgi:probable F420-dependent oxidoreductase
MEFGVYYTLRNPQGREVNAFYREVLDRAETIENLGYDGIFLGEHHFMAEGCVPSLLPLLAAFAVRTTRVRLGTNVLLLPLHHPLRVAEDAAVVDVISGGRLTLGVAAGQRPDEFAAFGANRQARGRAMEEGISLIRAAWSQGPIDFDGDLYQVHGVDVVPKPAFGPPPIWIGGFARAAVDRAVRLGNGYLIGGAGPIASTEPYQRYREALDRHGRSQAEVPLIGNRIVHVAETDAEAWTEAQEALLYRHNSYARWLAEAGDMTGNRVVAAVDELPREHYVVGSPQTCVRLIQEYRDHFPVDVMYFDGNQPGLSGDTALRSLQLFSQEVMPVLRGESA